MAYHFHWPLDAILNMEHADRHRWVEEISNINRRISDTPERSAAMMPGSPEFYL